MGKWVRCGSGRVIYGLGLALGILASAHAQTTKDPSTVDVLGLRLGMTADEVTKVATANVPNATFAPAQGTLSNGPYTTPTLTFSEEISDGPDPQYGTWPDKNFLWVVFSMRPKNPVIYIDRQITFSQEKAPTIQALISLLKSKYGAPDTIETVVGPGSTELAYTYGSSVKYSEYGSASQICELGLSRVTGTAGELAGGSFSQTAEGDVNGSIKQCGTWMIITIRPNSTNNQLVDSLEIELGNLPAMADSIDYMISSLAANAASTSASQAQGAAGNKPQL